MNTPMPPFNNFTSKAREAIRKSHEFAVERGQNHVTPVHLLTALIMQEESMVISVLDKLEIDTVALADSLIETIDTTPSQSTLSPSYQIYLTQEFGQVLEGAGKIAQYLKDEFVSTEHLFIAILDVPGQAREVLARFRIDRESVMRVLQELKSNNITDVSTPKKFR